jgi:hypothetical protein
MLAINIGRKINTAASENPFQKSFRMPTTAPYAVIMMVSATRMAWRTLPTSSNHFGRLASPPCGARKIIEYDYDENDDPQGNAKNLSFKQKTQHIVNCQRNVP